MNLKKFIVAVSIILIAVCILCACQSSDSQTETTADSALPELNIGVDNLEPFFTLTKTVPMRVLTLILP